MCPEAHQKVLLSCKGSIIVPLARKKPDSFSIGLCNSFLFIHCFLLHSCSQWKTHEVVFPSKWRWIRRFLVLVQRCSQKHFFLLNFFASRHEGRFLFACLLRKYCLIWWLLIAANLWFERDVLSAARWEVKPDISLVATTFPLLLCAFNLWR